MDNEQKHEHSREPGSNRQNGGKRRNKENYSGKRSASRDRFRHQAQKKQKQSTLVNDVLSGDRKALSQAITLIESNRSSDYREARHILESCLPKTGESTRIGITGIPGVGKSTFIDRLGRIAVENDHKLAVLTIDPSSTRSGGSILGDKTRMGELARYENVYIRPSPTGGSLGGVARKTRETMLLCEAAGYDLVFIETVGVGQSETAVRSMVDCFLLLTLAGGGDELQGIKRGIVEMADLIVINKAEDPDSKLIRQAISTYNNALEILPSPSSGWKTEVLTCSALEDYGIDHVWKKVQSFMKHIRSGGYFDRQRRDQVRQWMYETIDQQLKDAFYRHPEIKKQLKKAEQSIQEGKKSAFKAALELLQKYREVK